MASTGMIIDGVLGSEAIDSSGEVLDIEGADISDVDKGTLLLNWEHQPGEKGASTIVGVVKSAKKIYTRSDCENDRQRMYWDEIELPFIYGVARLYDGAGHEEAKRIAAIIRDHAANNEPIVCRYSVEGATLDKEDSGRLKSSVVRRVAVTVKPCNRTAVSGLIEDPNAPPGFEKKFVKQKVRDLLDFDPTEKSEPSDPLLQRLGRSSAIICNPLVEDQDLLVKATSAGSGDAAPSALTGGAALQREEIGVGGKKVSEMKHRALAALRDYGMKSFDRSEFRSFAKTLMPEASDEFLDHFSDLAGNFHAKRSDLAKREPSAPAPKPAAKATPKLPAPQKAVAPAPPADDGEKVKINYGTIRGVPTIPPKDFQGLAFDEKNGILHTRKGSFPLYNPDKGFKMVQHPAAKKGAFYKDGVLHVAPGADMKTIPHNGPNKKFREIYNSEPIEEFHSGKVMPNYIRVHDLNKAGRLPDEVLMHAAVFAMMSPNTPVRPHEFMYSHMVDTWEDMGIDPRDPDFKKARGNWLGRNKPNKYPRLAGDYFRGQKDIHLDSDSLDTGRKAGDTKAFMLGPNKFKNVEQYHKLHSTLVDLVKRHGGDTRSAVAEMMQHKAKEMKWKTQRYAYGKKLRDAAAQSGLKDDFSNYVNAKMAEHRAKSKLPVEREPGADDDDETPMSWDPRMLPSDEADASHRSLYFSPSRRNVTGIARQKFIQEATDLGLEDHLTKHVEGERQKKFGKYQGVTIPGLAPKTGRFTLAMAGGGNSIVPDTHIVRHLFGMDTDKDAATLAYLKNSVLWNANNHHVLEGIDRWYAKNHPAAKLMQTHPKWGKNFKDDPEQANFPAFWRHWCSIAQDERNRGIDNGTANNEFSTHEPFWLGIDKFVKAEGDIDDDMVAKMLTMHKRYEADYGEIPGQMMYFSHLVPHLLEAAKHRETHDDWTDFAKTLKLDALGIELRKAAEDVQVAQFADPRVPTVYGVHYRKDGGEHRAGRFVTHDGRLQHLEDYYGLLKQFLPEGPVDTKMISKIHGLKMSPHLRIDVEQVADAKAKEDEAAAAPPPAPDAPRPPSVFEYYRAGYDRPHTLEVHGGVYTLDGNRLSHPEVQTVVGNWKSGAATIRYKNGGAPPTEIRKMEEMFVSLAKAGDPQYDEDTLLQHSRAAEAAGHLPKGHSDAFAQHLYQDPMTGLGNQKAWMNFAAKNKPGTYMQMDLNDFSQVNNAFGHEAGNGGLRAFGQAARKAMDESVGSEHGKLFRSGGDEFSAHFPSYEHAAKFHRALTDNLDQIAPIGGVHKVTVSSGFGPTAQIADQASYMAKERKYQPGQEATPQRNRARVFKMGDAPNLAHSLVPGAEGALPIHDAQAHAVHQQVKPAPAALPPAPAV